METVCRMPVRHKLKGFETKRVLRRALGPTLPRKIVTRKKMGFPTPIEGWFRGPYRSSLRSLLLGRRSLSTEYVDPAYTARMLDTHASGRWNLHEPIWTLANLELWLRIFIEGRAPEDAWRPYADGVDGEFVSTRTYAEADQRQVPRQFLPAAWEPRWPIPAEKCT